MHANNSYIEVLVGMGVIGALALAWLMFAAIAIGDAMLVVDCRLPRLPIVGRDGGGRVAIAIHALVDSFLTFTPTYTVFAIAAGLLFPHAGSHAASPLTAQR